MAINRLRQQQIFDSFDPVSLTGGMGYQEDEIPGVTYPSTSYMPPSPMGYDAGMDPDVNPQAQMPTMRNPPRILQNPNEPRQNWMQMIDQLYNPETEATNRFNTLLDQAPELGRPGIARRLAATGMAMGNKDPIGTAEKVMYAPYLREMEDWKAKTGPYYNAANLERQANVNERQLTGQMVTAQQGQQRLDETERKNRETADINRIRAEAYAFKQTHPDWKFNFSGPTVMVTDPLTGQVHNTGIPTGSLSDMDRLNLMSQNRQAEIRVGGDEARKTQEVRNAGAANVATIREYGPDGTGSTAGNNPSQQRIARNNRFQSAWDQYPEYRKFLVKPASPNGDWQMKDPPTWGLFSSASIADKEAYDKVRSLVNPGTTGQSQGGNRSSSTNTGQPTPPPQIPKTATRVQYDRGLNKWRYQDAQGKWIEVQGGR